MNIIHYSIRSFFTNEYYSIIRFASKRLFVATLINLYFALLLPWDGEEKVALYSWEATLVY